MPLNTSPVSAICGTHLGLTNAPTSITGRPAALRRDRKSTRLNSSHLGISYAVFCLKKKKKKNKHKKINKKTPTKPEQRNNIQKDNKQTTKTPEQYPTQTKATIDQEIYDITHHCSTYL